MVQLAAFVAATYAAIITAMYIAQTWLLFPTTLAGLARVQLPASAQRIEARTPDRETLVGVRRFRRLLEAKTGAGPALVTLGVACVRSFRALHDPL